MNKASPTSSRTGLARALSKLGFCSRAQAKNLIVAGRVRVNGKVSHRPEQWVDLAADQIQVDSHLVREATKAYFMLNKPRGLVCTAADEHDRTTVYSCLRQAGLAGLSAVGRLDMASEGLLLFTNDTDWGARILSPESGLEKTYHVQINCQADTKLLESLERGLQVEHDFLRVRRASVLRRGTRHCWLELVLTEGKNRHIRRLLAAHAIEVLRLVRIAIGPLQLGDLGKGMLRPLTQTEIDLLGG